MSPVLTLVRHSRTLANESGILQGIRESESARLSPEGVRIAENLRLRLSDRSFDIAYASSSERAVQTAKVLLGDQAVKLVLDDRLREVDVGDATGSTQKDWLALHPPRNRENWRADYWDAPYPGGESYAQLFARLIDFGQELYRREEERILIVTHTTPFKLFLAYIRHQDPKGALTMRVSNGETWDLTLQADGGWETRPVFPDADDGFSY